MSTKIALLSQPNTGKSTLFNGLTGSHQHVGNWPGKTVEKKEGTFKHGDKTYTITDLPGSYSLSANSDEETVTRDYIADSDCELVCIMADASQLERTMFMLADYCGIQKPAMLILNMMDIAEEQGKKIDVAKIESLLGIPVVAMSAAKVKQYGSFFETLDRAISKPKKLCFDKLDALYSEIIGDEYNTIKELIPDVDDNIYSPVWLASKLIELDRPAEEIVEKIVDRSEYNKIIDILDNLKDGSLKTGECKFNWIESILSDTVKSEKAKGEYKMKWFDKLMTTRFWGKLTAIILLFVGFGLAMVVGMPIMGIGMNFAVISKALHGVMQCMPVWLTSLIADALVAALGYTLSMAGLVLGVTFVYGFMEEVGIMARISYAFDNTFSKMGLQGKSVLPMIISLGCNMGGAYSCRVIDSWGQKTLTMALSWAVPCAGCWGVIALLSGIYFGTGGMLVIVALFAVIFFHIWLTAKIFRPSLAPKEQYAGLIMELPPYHKPKWGALLRYVFNRFVTIFWKAFKLIALVTVIVWLLSGMGIKSVESSILYKLGKFCEPVTQVFGLKWQMFIAWLTSIMGKEATLGVFSALFTGGGGIFITQTMGTGASTGLAAAIGSTITKPEALAFIFAFTFNVPCLMTVGAANEEIHSWKWTLRITFYYMVSALVYAFLAYRIGQLIW